MTRDEYKTLRRTYRILRREDAKWRPNPYAARNTLQNPPRRSAAFFGLIDARVAETFLRRVGDEGRGNHRLRPGPRASKILGVRSTYGQFANMDLSKRVALRSALRQIDAIEARRAA